jgi:hypothetical protein
MLNEEKTDQPLGEPAVTPNHLLDAANETLFWALFYSGLKSHDRMVLFKSRKGLQDFFDWLEEERKEIKTEEGRPVLIKDMKYIVGGG